MFLEQDQFNWWKFLKLHHLNQSVSYVGLPDVVQVSQAGQFEATQVSSAGSPKSMDVSAITAQRCESHNTT